MTTSVLGKWQIEEWIAGRVAATLKLPVADVSPEAVFSELGLSSVQAVELAADLEDWSGCEIPATFVYECPSVGEAAAYVVAARAQREPG